MPLNAVDRDSALLLLVAGAKGAVGSTIAVSVAGLKEDPGARIAGLTTADKFAFLGPVVQIELAGWDTDRRILPATIDHHGVVPTVVWRRWNQRLTAMDIRLAPSADLSLGRQVEALRKDMQDFKRLYPYARAVLINLLPASQDFKLPHRPMTLKALLEQSPDGPPDLAYAAAAVLEGIPVINFTPNAIEIEALCKAAREAGAPLAGRDGKTGQTYFKVVLASAFKARGLKVDGWYSLNILGNADGKNLMDPDRSRGKLRNKTRLLDDLLGYEVGQAGGQSAHKVRIDYYPPRGDAKEAWDVIDFSGLLDLPMSMRVNLQGRDSILAAPMAIDLARWVAALQLAGRGGPIAELGFFFKRPVGSRPPLTFQDQLACLDRLEDQINARLDPARVQ